MEPFRFKCRAIDIQHACSYKDDSEPDHPDDLLSFIEDALWVTEKFEFHRKIVSSANNYQVKTDFDTTWIGRMDKVTAWKIAKLPTFKRIELDTVSKKFRQLNVGIPDIKPDGILTDHNVTAVVEVEQSNRKNIWFDFIKIMLLIGQQMAHFGLLLVPRNYAHKVGVWDLFNEARYYRWCLIRFAGVDLQLFSKLAIVGYTQEVLIDNNWRELDTRTVTDIKRQAKDYFQHK
jgi:hypothetical protein